MESKLDDLFRGRRIIGIYRDILIAFKGHTTEYFICPINNTNLNPHVTYIPVAWVPAIYFARKLHNFSITYQTIQFLEETQKQSYKKIELSYFFKER